MTPDQRAAALRLARYVEVGAAQAPTGAEIAALLRELAAEPVQEPVAEVGDLIFDVRDRAMASGMFNRDKLYAHPPKRKPLTDERIEAIIAGWWRDDLKMKYAQLARAVERAHGIGHT